MELIHVITLIKPERSCSCLWHIHHESGWIKTLYELLRNPGLVLITVRGPNLIPINSARQHSKRSIATLFQNLFRPIIVWLRIYMNRHLKSNQNQVIACSAVSLSERFLTDSIPFFLSSVP